jgi:PAS domain-containing protein
MGNPLLNLLAALLPAPERDGLIRRGADPALWSLLLGLVQLFLGSALLVSNALDTFQGLADAVATYTVEEIDPRALNSPENRYAVVGSGPIVWFTWVARPTTWLLASVPLVGIARLIAFAATRESVGEPVVWLGVRLFQAAGRLLRGSQEKVRFGPERPDRVLRERDGGLVVLSRHPKPDWNERVTLEIGDRFYRLVRTEERMDGSWWTHAYVLQEADPSEVIRALIRYEPPNRREGSLRASLR